jgi:hypothetical protein
MTMLQTEHSFSLPKGYVDADGTLHRDGTMRLATALDEIAPLRDERVVANNAYLAVIVLSRVITRLGSLSTVTPKTVELLFASDVEYLQQLYNRLNYGDQQSFSVSCPGCAREFEVRALGGS